MVGSRNSTSPRNFGHCERTNRVKRNTLAALITALCLPPTNSSPGEGNNLPTNYAQLERLSEPCIEVLGCVHE